MKAKFQPQGLIEEDQFVRYGTDLEQRSDAKALLKRSTISNVSIHTSRAEKYRLFAVTQFKQQLVENVLWLSLKKKLTFSCSVFGFVVLLFGRWRVIQVQF